MIPRSRMAPVPFTRLQASKVEVEDLTQKPITSQNPRAKTLFR